MNADADIESVVELETTLNLLTKWPTSNRRMASFERLSLPIPRLRVGQRVAGVHRITTSGAVGRAQFSGNVVSQWEDDDSLFARIVFHRFDVPATDLRSPSNL
jgi:hypothetical protein